MALSLSAISSARYQNDIMQITQAIISFILD